MASKKSFVKGALILTFAGVLAKVLGALYRIPFNRIVGEEGAALYALGYSLYLILFALSTAGIPLAVSKLVAVAEERKAYGESERLLKVSLGFMASFGTIAFLVVFFGADWISENLFHEPRAALSIRCLAPAMLFSCLTSVFRGYFQGKQLMSPTAISQVTEQLFRVLLIFVAIYALAGESLEVIVAGATLASAVGALLSFSFLLTFFIRHRRRHLIPKEDLVTTVVEKKSVGKILSELLWLTIPICIGALVLPLMQFVDTTVIIPRLMSIGYSSSKALIHQGYLTSYAMPIISLPFIITTALAASLVPAVSEANEKKDKEKLLSDTNLAILLTIVIMLPASVGLVSLGKPIIWLLFGLKEPGYALSYVGFSVLGIGIYQVSSGILQGLGKAYLPMTSLIIALLLKISLTYYLTGLDALGVKGAALATVVAYLVAAATNLTFLSRYLSWKWLSFKDHILKPGVSVFVMAIVVQVCYLLTLSYIGNSLATLLAIAFGGLSYFVVLFFVGGIDKEMVRKIPKIGNKLANLMK